MTVTLVAGRYPYAVKRYFDYLRQRLNTNPLTMSDVWVATQMPQQQASDKRPVVLITQLNAGPYDNLVLSWRRLRFAVRARDEMTGAECCEQVRAEVVASKWAHICRDTRIVGEPGRWDFPDEPIPRFQTTIDVLLRESYKQLTIIRNN